MKLIITVWHLIWHELHGRIFKPGFVRNIFWYGGINGFQAFIPFCLLPLLTRTVSAEQYGLYGFFVAVVWLVSPFVRLGIDSTLLYKRFNLSHEQLGDYWSSALILSFGVGLSLLGLAWLFPTFFGFWGIKDAVQQGIIAPNGILQYWLALVILLALLESILAIMLHFSIAIEQKLTYAAIAIGQRLLWALLVLWLVILGGFQVLGLLLSQVLSLVLPVLLGLIWLRQLGYLRLKIGSTAIPAIPAILKEMLSGLKYGLPLVIQLFSLGMIRYVDRFFLKYITGLGDLGIYVAGTQVSLVFFVFVASLQSLWHPWALARLASRDADAHLRLKKALLLMCPIFLLLAIVAAILLVPITKWLLTGDFLQAVVVVPWLVLGYLAQGFYLIFSVFLLHQERTLLVALVAAVALCLNLALNYPLIVQNGIIGAAQATLLAYTVAAALCAWLVFKNGWQKALLPSH